MTNFKISELASGSKKVDVSGVITEISEPRAVNYRTGGSGMVAHAMLQDDTGSVDLVLWNDDIPLVKKDALVAIENGFMSEWQGRIQLNKGKFGRMIVQ